MNLKFQEKFTFLPASRFITDQIDQIDQTDQMHVLKANRD